MSAMQISGACILAAPFVGLFALITITEGFWDAVFGYALAACLFGAICLGTFMLFGSAS